MRAKVVLPDRTFLRRMITLASSRPHLEDWIRLNHEFRSVLTWWHTFLDKWHGTSLLRTHIFNPPSHHVFSDASGSQGCGALWNQEWFQAEWPLDWSLTNIASKELVPIVVATAVWGPRWKGSHIQFHTDNMAVTQVIQSKTSHDEGIMHLFRCLHFFSVVNDIKISAVHIPGRCPI